jgi:hypothetical protein
MVDNALTILRWGIGLVLIFFTWYIISEGLKDHDGDRMADAISQAEQDVEEDPLSTKSIGTITDGIADTINDMGGKDSELKFWERCRNAIHRAIEDGTQFTKDFWEAKSEMIKNVAKKLGEGIKSSILPIIQPVIDFVYGVLIQPILNTFWGGFGGTTEAAVPVTPPATEETPVSQQTEREDVQQALPAPSPRVPRKQVERDPSGLFN